MCLHDYLRANVSLISLLTNDHRTEEKQQVMTVQEQQKRVYKRKSGSDD